MQTARKIISTHPEVKGSVNEALLKCIEECLACSQACIACADACLAEDMVQDLRQCIRLNLDCADICDAAAKLGTRRTGSNEFAIKQIMDVCAEACRACGEECKRHADQHEHCRICAEACQQCEIACRDAAASITP